jgi:hypothetical protein
MWIMGSDFFLSVVRKDCAPGQLLVRARREGDIERVFGRHVEVTRDESADYLFRARIDEQEVADVMRREVLSISYPNFKDSVRDQALHDAYLGCWHALARTQDPPPYSGRRATRSLYEDEQEIAQRSQKPIAQRKGGK